MGPLSLIGPIGHPLFTGIGHPPGFAYATVCGGNVKHLADKLVASVVQGHDFHSVHEDPLGCIVLQGV